MFDLEISKLALIGAVALVVIGPEKMPRVARTIGTLIGKAQRYVSDVKAEVNRSMDMEDLKKMKETMDSAMTDVQKSVLDATTKLNEGVASLDMDGQAENGYQPIIPYQWTPPPPSYQHRYRGRTRGSPSALACHGRPAPVVTRLRLEFLSSFRSIPWDHFQFGTG